MRQKEPEQKDDDDDGTNRRQLPFALAKDHAEYLVDVQGRAALQPARDLIKAHRRKWPDQGKPDGGKDQPVALPCRPCDHRQKIADQDIGAGKDHAKDRRAAHIGPCQSQRLAQHGKADRAHLRRAQLRRLMVAARAALACIVHCALPV